MAVIMYDHCHKCWLLSLSDNPHPHTVTTIHTIQYIQYINRTYSTYERCGVRNEREQRKEIKGEKVEKNTTQENVIVRVTPG